MLFNVLSFACVVLHEFGYIIIARRYGIETPDVTLLPIGGVARLPCMPKKPAHELTVAIAGPMANVAIAFLLFVFLVLGTIQPGSLSRIDDPSVSLLARLANIFLVLFLRALLARKRGGVRATQLAASLGQVLAFALGLLGLFGKPLLIFIAIFVYLAAAGEARMSAFNEAARGLSVGDATEMRFNGIPIEPTLAAASDTLFATAQHEFPGVDADAGG